MQLCFADVADARAVAGHYVAERIRSSGKLSERGGALSDSTALGQVKGVRV